MPRLSPAETHQIRDQLLLQLREKTGELAEHVLPGGEQRGGEWRGVGPDGSKWGVVTRGPKRGWWRNFGSGQGGKELLSFVRDGACDGDWRRAWHWAWDYVGGKPLEPPSRPHTPAPAPAPTDNGKRHWLAATPFTWDGPAGQYLQGRGIDPALLPRPPAVLRDAEIWNEERRCRLPAMLASITDPQTRQHIALHRTYLERHAGGWRKAAVRTAKMTMGRMRGGIIGLTRGASDRNWRDMPPGDVLLLAEGIENALSLAQTYPHARAAAYVAAGNLLELVLPEKIETIWLCRDRDGINRAISEGRGAMAAHWEAEGRTVEIWEPPPGYKDANDYLMGRKAT